MHLAIGVRPLAFHLECISLTRIAAALATATTVRSLVSRKRDDYRSLKTVVSEHETEKFVWLNVTRRKTCTDLESTRQCNKMFLP